MQPGVDTIEGVTIGTLRMREESRANLHIPSALAYGNKQIGAPGGSLYVPAGADIIFDIEVFGKIDPNGPGWFMDEDVGLPRQRDEL
jgi:FKBP-type peptidyl-prolyl cis-trans isomerase